MKNFFDEKPYLSCLILFVLSLTIYMKTLGFDFIPSWDDTEYVLENTRVHGLTFENITLIFSSAYFSNYAPLHLLSYAVDFSLWGLSAKGFHLTNILIHALNSALVFVLARRITGNGFASFVAGALFAFHPLNVENAAWVSERKTLLTSAFSFGSILAYISFRQNKKAGFYILSLALFILALLSKPLAVVLPLALASYEIFLRKNWRALKWTVPCFALALVLSFVAFKAHSDASALESSSLSADVLLNVVYPTMLPIYWEYIRLIIWPSGQSGFYDAVLHSFREPVVMVALAAWTTVFIAVLWKGGRQVRFWFFWFWIWLLPVSNIIPLPVYYADRYMYMPAIGFFVLFGLLMSLAGRLINFKTAAIVSACVIIAFGAASFIRMDVWKDEVAFWEDTAIKSPGQYKAQLNLGYAYDMKGRFDEAEKAYQEAVRIYPDQEAISNLEMVRMKRAAFRPKP